MRNSVRVNLRSDVYMLRIGMCVRFVSFPRLRILEMPLCLENVVIHPSLWMFALSCLTMHATYARGQVSVEVVCSCYLSNKGGLSVTYGTLLW